MTKPVRCQREGCLSKVHPKQQRQGLTYCSALCRQVDITLTTAQQRDVAPDVWAALVLVADAVSAWRVSVENARVQGQRR